MSKKFGGTFTALATPFLQGDIDRDSFKKLVTHQVKNGVTGFVVNGTTGESPTLGPEEVEELFRLARRWAPDLKIILGVGTNSTRSSLEWVERANALNVDGVLAVVPYYNKPPQRGLVAHFQELAEVSEAPVILYNVPGRSAQSLSVESVGTLSKHPNIAGIKESTGDLKFLKELQRVVSEDFCFLSGDDGTALEFCLEGGDGVIGVITHLIPQQFSQWIRRALEGDREVLGDKAKWKDLIDGIYVEANPIPVKSALKDMGLFKSAELRLPLVALGKAEARELTKCLQSHQLI
ncbi:4-hydroxy-tetrahydrodipicolinate synthase [bacterium]|nr:4-hydroxy-tetrahydrodipicolinate synthase [bacterium]